MQKKSCSDSQFEQYLMRGLQAFSNAEARLLILKRNNLIFDNRQCEVISIYDITAYKRLEIEEKRNKVLMALNKTVHHGMLVPLRACHEASKYLLERMRHKLDKELALTIHITNELLRYHIQDLLDQSVINNNGFKAMFVEASISKAIGEIILMIQQMIN